MPARERIIVIRFSSMGDVAMIAPVLEQFSRQYPSAELVIVTHKKFEIFFDRVHNKSFYAFDKNRYKGLWGLYRFYSELKELQPTAIADLHDSLRSRILCFFFNLLPIKIASLDKGRSEKKALTRKNNKVFKQLKPTPQRYADVLNALGYDFDLNNHTVRTTLPLTEKIISLTGEKNMEWIGVSPFAQHPWKVYPLNKMQEVITRLNQQTGKRIFIFGGGPEEKRIAEKWASAFTNVVSLIGKLSLEEELSVISHLDKMLTMDSAGMHMASLFGVRCISVWGATHPYAGFLGIGQQYEDCMQIELHCRPCSVYGNKPCWRGDFACMEDLPPEKIVAALQ
ncbi:glycosyltransferase family 9 protein [Haoranjiania flava]|uniref:Glycosyltransferase family 9 protein n=1 Tax=Haoranjiania flava TaxID=1856322 RepID=A0AAE3IKF4_9BACT|nr:glycosyltransferase family 9 protein [Haoranjiania flava]MCU7693700.1 glycosyltransferase family 9 protein [Haoranjiania flava]